MVATFVNGYLVQIIGLRATNDLRNDLYERILRQSVLKRWAARCSEQCVAEWNEAVAPIVGIKAEK